MVSKLILILSSWFAPADPVPAVAVEAAYTVVTYTEETKCCGLCVDGLITHGDGHETPCACPPDCACKAKSVMHKPAVLHPCPNGKCNLKPSK